MKEEIRLAIATAVLQGLVGATDETGSPLAGPKTAASLALEYADALLEEVRHSPASATSKGSGPPAASSSPASGDVAEAAS